MIGGFAAMGICSAGITLTLILQVCLCVSVRVCVRVCARAHISSKSGNATGSITQHSILIPDMYEGLA